MDFKETEEQVMFRQTARKFSQDEIKPISSGKVINLTYIGVTRVDVRGEA